MGVESATLTPALEQEYGLSSVNGTLLVGIEPNSPASDAGFAVGDVITSFGSTQINSEQDLTLALDLTPPGTTVQVAYVDSSGSTHTTAVTVSSYPTDTPAPLITSI